MTDSQFNELVDRENGITPRVQYEISVKQKIVNIMQNLKFEKKLLS